ncbi:transmembrane and coiled-coil domains protein 2 isoform X2 [Apis mellifera caucasica]|nr:transmembrane and coiled-coil domains protein 2 isoform X2 [Apis mellifera caucasica]KAG9432343.1 transmembrane and coiled-coil domains protein 2 isoform X2 [Apis mellifera carnica]
MKGSRQKSPGTVIRVDAMDESNTNLITAEQDEFVPNIHLPTDDDGEQYHATQSFLSNGSSELITDDVDSNSARVCQAIENIQNKIAKTRELIRIEQTTRDGNGDNASVEDEKAHHGSATLPGGCSLGSTHSAAAMKFPSEEGSECSSVTSESGPGSRGQAHTCHNSNNAALSLKSIFSELQEHRENLERMKDKLEGLKSLQQEVTYLSHALQEERFRCERLEEQINDLTELHQNEVENLKQTITDMEEKVQYQSEDRLRDIHEMLESCQTKICKMEHQQQQHQQYVTLEGLDNSNARALVVKLINVVLTVLQVILLLVATGAGIMMPFLRTRVRILTTTLVVLGIVFVLKQWPEVHDVGSHLMRHLKQTLAVK